VCNRYRNAEVLARFFVDHKKKFHDDFHFSPDGGLKQPFATFLTDWNDYYRKRLNQQQGQT